MSAISNIEQLLLSYFPMVFKCAVVLLLLVSPSMKLFPFPSSSRERPQPVVNSGQKIPVVMAKYKSYVDDIAAKKGDYSDIIFLQQHGYNKFRYMSESFSKRMLLHLKEKETDYSPFRFATLSLKKIVPFSSTALSWLPSTKLVSSFASSFSTSNNLDNRDEDNTSLKPSLEMKMTTKSRKVKLKKDILPRRRKRTSN